MQVQPYLFFDGRCDEALAFYKKTVGAQVQMLMRYKEMPEPHDPIPPTQAEKVMHASIRIGDSTVLCSDGNCVGKPAFQGFSLTLVLANEAEAKRLYDALGDGGQVQMPLAKTFFSPSFGMLTDRFGVGWMIYVEAR